MILKQNLVFFKNYPSTLTVFLRRAL